MFPRLCIVDETLLELALLHKTTLVTCRPERGLSDEILDEFMHTSLAQDMCLMLAVWRLTQLGLADAKVSKDPRCRELLQYVPLGFTSHQQFWGCLLETQRVLGLGASCGWLDGVPLASTRVVSVAHAFFRWCCWTRYFCWVSRSHAAQAWAFVNLPCLIATVVCTRNCQRRFSAGLLQLFV